MKKDWPFKDPENVIALTLRDVMEDNLPILLVTHDAEDGCWQFLDGRDNPDPKVGIVVCLGHIVEYDPSIRELADLPLGWRAWRATPAEPWQREEMEPEAEGESENQN